MGHKGTGWIYPRQRAGLINHIATTRHLESCKRERARCAAVGRRGLFTIRKTVGRDAESSQVEYLVVNYSKSEPNVTLSLRQADILHALAHDEELSKAGGCVPDLQEVAKSRFVNLPTSP
jgi:hypothetical protein